MVSFVCVGSAAPDLPLESLDAARDAARPRLLHGEPPARPRVLAFLRGWSAELEPPREVAAIRAELRGLDAELVVLSETGAWWFRPDDHVERCSTGPEIAHAIASLSDQYGVSPAGEAVFVIDERNIVRFAHRPAHPLDTRLAVALAAAGEAILEPPQPAAIPTAPPDRHVAALVTGFALAFLRCKARDRTASRADTLADELEIELHVNGEVRTLHVDPRMSLLDVLHERLELPGTKRGCDMGQCGACTVLVDGTHVLSCLTLAVTAQRQKLVTVEGGMAEGLTCGDELPPAQHAPAEPDRLPCGPGPVLSVIGRRTEARARTTDDRGRSGGYPIIVAARRARG